MTMKKRIGLIVGIVAIFVAGMCVDRLLVSRTQPPIAAARPSTVVASEEGGDGEEGVVAQVGGEEGEDAKFVVAVPADAVEDDADQDGEATVEEVRDENGLTDEELAAKFKRENPEAWEQIQKRRRAMIASQQKALANRRDFLAAVDIAFMTADQRKVHMAFAKALAARSEARARLRKAQEEGREPDVEDYRLCNLSERILRENAADESRALREAAARSLGLPEADVPGFVEMLRKMDDVVNEFGPHSGGGMLR